MTRPIKTGLLGTFCSNGDSIVHHNNGSENLRNRLGE